MVAQLFKCIEDHQTVCTLTVGEFLIREAVFQKAISDLALPIIERARIRQVVFLCGLEKPEMARLASVSHDPPLQKHCPFGSLSFHARKWPRGPTW